MGLALAISGALEDRGDYDGVLNLRCVKHLGPVYVDRFDMP